MKNLQPQQRKQVHFSAGRDHNSDRPQRVCVESVLPVRLWMLNKGVDIQLYIADTNLRAADIPGTVLAADLPAGLCETEKGEHSDLILSVWHAIQGTEAASSRHRKLDRAVAGDDFELNNSCLRQSSCSVYKVISN
jgi:hypothetical protein